MDKEKFEKEKEKFEEWFWSGKGREAFLKFESPSVLMLIAWMARTELDEEKK